MKNGPLPTKSGKIIIYIFFNLKLSLPYQKPNQICKFSRWGREGIRRSAIPDFKLLKSIFPDLGSGKTQTKSGGMGRAIIEEITLFRKQNSFPIKCINNFRDNSVFQRKVFL